MNLRFPANKTHLSANMTDQIEGSDNKVDKGGAGEGGGGVTTLLHNQRDK